MRDAGALRALAEGPRESQWPLWYRPRPAFIPFRRSWRHVAHGRSPWRAHEPTHAQEIVRGADEQRVQLRACDPAEARLAQAARRLGPPEDFLHPLPTALAHGETPVSQGAAIEPRRALPGDRRHVGPNAPRPQVPNEGAGH